MYSKSVCTYKYVSPFEAGASRGSQAAKGKFQCIRGSQGGSLTLSLSLFEHHLWKEPSQEEEEKMVVAFFLQASQ